MAHKKSLFTLITAFIFMALVSTGCERSYAPIDESLATPTIEGNAFPDELPADMEGVFEAGAQTATAQAIEAGAAPAEEPTAVPVVNEGDTELAPTEETAAGETATDGTPPTATSTAPVLDPTATTAAAATDIPSVDVNNLPASYALKKGEFPYCIARRFNVDPGELLGLNGISTAQAGIYQPGLSLRIPTSGNAFPSTRARNTHPITYIVPETTNVYTIACFFGDVDPADIIAKNPSITNADSIAAGTSLQIP